MDFYDHRFNFIELIKESVRVNNIDANFERKIRLALSKQDLSVLSSQIKQGSYYSGDFGCFSQQGNDTQ